MKQKQANPQGKGLSQVAGMLSTIPASQLAPKNVTQVTDDLFTSMFILSSKFSFKPIVGRSYWLYLKNGQYQLSLIAPEEWSAQVYGMFIGCCVLHEDVSWTIELSTQAIANNDFCAFIEKQRKQLEQKISASDSLEQALPGYLEKLPYYQRALTTMLTFSLKTSMNKSGIAQLNYQQAKQLTNQSGQ